MINLLSTHLLCGSSLPKDRSEKVIENYEYFRNQINKSGLDLELLYSSILKLFIVDVSLDRDSDNPQLIFESLNSTGLDLSQADLVRNYILMGQEQKLQEKLYNNYWYPMEQLFEFDNEGRYFDRFMRDYLTIKLGRIPTIPAVYKEFKKYYLSIKHIGVEEIVKDIKYYAEIFVKMSLHNTGDEILDENFADIDELQVEVSFPLLLQVYSDWVNNKLSKDEFSAILKAIESYVFRRAIVGIPTNSLNKTFANFYKEVDQENYLESFYAALQLKDSYRRFPNDEEFKKELMVKDVYSIRSRNYLLRKLENYNRKEKVRVEEYTIEHILPQNKDLSKEWREMLGSEWESVQKKYLHTIGNLTLTGYNSELSDRPFLVKRDMEGGFKDSPIRLNKGLATIEKWDETEIIKRANSLADKAMIVFPYKELSDEILEKYRPKEKGEGDGQYTIDQFSNFLQDDMLELFNHLRNRIMNLDSSVKEEFKKLYIAYKNTTNFVDIVPQKSKLRLSLNLEFEEIKDPNGICRDITNLGRWGNGDVEVGISKIEEIDYVMDLIKQSYKKHAELNGD